MKKFKKLGLLLLLGVICGCSQNIAPKPTAKTQLNSEEATRIKNVILFIGDGMGPNHVDAGGVFKGEPLVFDQNNNGWNYHAYSNTDSLTSTGFTLDTTKSLLRPDLNPSLYDGTPSPYSSEGAVLGTSGSITTYTDSAAGGSAIATGQKLTNARIGMDIQGNAIQNLVEIASGLGKKTGVLTSDNLAGATPASFLAHVGERHLYDDIITSISDSPVDLVMAQTLSNYTDKIDTYEAMFEEKGFDNIAYSVDELNADANRILALFPGIVTKTDPRAPTLAELTVFALDYLDTEDGFFLMVEGSNIDKKSHANQTKLMLNELLAFDEAIDAAMKWAYGRDDTLMVVSADHETGALYYDRENATQDTIVDSIKWLSTNHSRTRVDIAVYGNAEEFLTLYANQFDTLEGLPYWDNTDIFKLCCYYL